MLFRSLHSTRLFLLSDHLHFPFTLFPCTPLCLFLPVYTPFCLPLFSSLLLSSPLSSTLLLSAPLLTALLQCSSHQLLAAPQSLFLSAPLFFLLCSPHSFLFPNWSLLLCQRQSRHRQINPEAPLSAVSKPQPQHHKAGTQENYH